jgi:hypothetical protein
MEPMIELLLFALILFFLLGFVLFFGYLFVEIARGYAGIFRRLRRRPQFGLRTALEIIVVFAVTFSILRWAGVWDRLRFRVMFWGDAPLGLVLGPISLMLAVGIVCGVHVVAADVWDLLKRKRSSAHRGRRSADPWEADENPDPLIIETITESSPDRIDGMVADPVTGDTAKDDKPPEAGDADPRDG